LVFGFIGLRVGWCFELLVGWCFGLRVGLCIGFIE